MPDYRAKVWPQTDRMYLEAQDRFGRGVMDLLHKHFSRGPIPLIALQAELRARWSGE